jgi:DNA-binding transcriptional regulator YhcF (GntR family)
MQVSTQMGPFSIVPEWLLDRGLSSTALKLYIVLARFADWETGIAFPSRDTLADRIGATPKTIDRLVKELVDAECIEKHSRGRYASAKYRVFQVDPRGTKMSSEETEMSGEGTKMSEREDKNVHLTITTEQEPLKQKPLNDIGKPKNADEYQPSQTLLEELATKFPHVSLDDQLERFRDHHMAKGSKFSLWDRAFRKWVTQSVDWNKTSGAAKPERLTNNQKAALLAMKYREEARKAQEIEPPVNPKQVKQIEAQASSWLKGIDDV